MSLKKLISECLVENNPMAKYRLADSIYVFTDADIAYAEKYNLEQDLSRFECIKKLMYKDIDGRRVYFRLLNDSIFLYIDCTLKPTEYLSVRDREVISEKLNFAYNSMNYIKFAEQSKNLDWLENVFREFNVAYSKIIIEPRGHAEGAYTVLYNKEEDKVYDVVHEVYGVSAVEFKKSVNKNCRVLGGF
ncbi:MAG: hypothetical protein IJE43_19695 [Alphaproteobacteria bacterium]|nr:hypothetical protein [Alphaproteobacteria bacterium]